MPEYTPPTGTANDFDFQAYTPPSGTNADFDFTGKEISEIDSEITGQLAIDTDIDSEITGDRSVTEIDSEVEGVGQTTEIDSEITGIKLATEIDSEILGVSVADRQFGYRVIVKDSSGNVVGEHMSYKEIEFGKRLNNYGEGKFDIRVTDPLAPDYVALRQNSIYIYRVKGEQVTLVWSGQQALSQADLNDKGNNWIDVHCFTWFELLYHRYTGAVVTYEATDMGAIIEDVIDTTNADDPTGITIGTITPTTDRDREYNNQNIAELMINGANLASGLDFDITDLKVLNIYDIMGTDKTDSVVLEYGHNIKNLTITEDFVNPINRAIVLGEAVDASTLQRIERDDAGLQTTYGLFEGRLTEMDVSNVSTLEDKGDAAIRKYGLALLRVEFELVGNNTPSIDEFGIGDGIRLIAKSGFYNIDEQYRVFEWKVKFDSNNVEKLSLLLGKFIVI